MPWSNPKTDNSSDLIYPTATLIKTDSEDQQQATVLDYKPPVFNLGTPAAAVDYLQRKKQGQDFVLSDVLRKTTGVQDIEFAAQEAMIEQKILERLTEVQKQAYDEGFKLGSDEGYKQSFEKMKMEIDHGLTDLNQMLLQITNMKADLLAQNESQILQIIFKIAEKVILEKIEQKDEILIQVIREAIAKAQSEEDIRIFISESQSEFIKEYQNKLGMNDEIKNVEFEISSEVEPGGCIVQTNYGEIDARTSVRVQKIWDELKLIRPHLKAVNE